MAEDPPKLRLVDPDERAEPVPVADPPERPPGDDRTISRAGRAPGIAALCVGVAVLVVGLALSIRLLMGPNGDSDGTDGSTRSSAAASSSAAGPTSTIDPLSLIQRIPTSVGETTAVPTPTTTTPPPPTAPTAAATPGLLGVPADGGVASTPPVAAPATGTARIRIFNGFSAGEPLEVWEVSGSPVRYGEVAFGGLVEMTAGGRLLPSGVDLQLRFVRPGGDPTGPVVEGTSSKTGPWGWNFTPADSSSQTLVLTANPGLRVVRIDNVRALGAAKPGSVHVVPVVFHLVLEGTRTKRWAADGVGCLGPLSTDSGEFDVAVGTAVRLASADDATCGRTVSDAVPLERSTAVAVVGVEEAGERARLIALPLS